MPLKIKLDDNLGNWFFLHDEVQPIGKQTNTPPNKPTETIKTENTVNLSSENKKLVKSPKIKPLKLKVDADITKPQKMSYTKKDKSIEVKPKRKYTRK